MQPYLSLVTADPEALPADGAVLATVQTPAGETRYFRAGSGGSVLLLGCRGTRDPLGRALFRELAQRFRVVAPIPAEGAAGEPTMPGPGTSFSAWLRGVIDGLGLVSPGVVADEGTGIPALGFAMTDPDRVGRLVVVRRDAVDEAVPDALVADALHRYGHPLLLIRADPSADPADLVPRLAREIGAFLAPDPGAP